MKLYFHHYRYINSRSTSRTVATPKKYFKQLGKNDSSEIKQKSKTCCRKLFKHFQSINKSGAKILITLTHNEAISCEETLEKQTGRQLLHALGWRRDTGQAQAGACGRASEHSLPHTQNHNLARSRSLMCTTDARLARARVRSPGSRKGRCCVLPRYIDSNPTPLPLSTPPAI